MKTRDTFEEARMRKNRFGLTTRLVLLVTLEIEVCILVALGMDALLNRYVELPFDIPLILELVIVSSVVGVLVTGQLSRYFFNPIKKLGEAMGKVAEGDFTVELNTHSTAKEIQEIYSGFNLMTHELRATEILKTDFVSSASHEFKTPVSAIEGYAALLSACDDLTPEHREYVEKIRFNTKRLSSLTSSVLLLSKLESQEIPTNRTKFLVDEQIRQSIVALESQWVQKDIELDVELDRVSYLGNEQMMRHVWDNLISNAVKFSPQGGAVKLRLTKKARKLTFTIEDQGPGLSEDAQKHIFDKFYQGDSSHKQEGSGLGLALAKRILTIEKGQITAENIHECGCRFTVTLRTK